MMLKEQENTLRKYLLGELTEQEQETLELWLMSEEEAYDLLSAAEDDLIDELTAGKLSAHELERFNNHFLVAPERKRKLRFGHAFRRYAVEGREVALSKVRTPVFSIWDLFRYRPVLAYAGSGLIALIIGSGVWAGLRLQDMQRQLDESQAQGERTQSDFGALEQAVANLNLPASPNALVAVVLTPGLSRSATPDPSKEIPKVDLTSNASIAELSLVLLDDAYDSYRAVLVDEQGKELWTRDPLNPKKSDGPKVVVLIVPTNRLSEGNYSVRLSGRSATNPPENIASYPFHAVR